MKRFQTFATQKASPPFATATEASDHQCFRLTRSNLLIALVEPRCQAGNFEYHKAYIREYFFLA
jgi:hypothetical protein